VFERHQRSEKALVTALTEMYLQSVSTRKVKVTEELCGHEFSSATIGRMMQRNWRSPHTGAWKSPLRI
jgi:transposase-like protein